MRKILTAGFFCLLASANVFAEKAELFVIDEATVDFSELDELEAYVNENEGVTYADVLDSRSDLVLNVSDQPTFTDATSKKPPLGIPSFLWGCIFGVAGLAVVYFITDNKKETKKALWGCVTAAGVYIVVYVIYFFAVINAASNAGAI